jgi:hypothetical protein
VLASWPDAAGGSDRAPGGCKVRVGRRVGIIGQRGAGFRSGDRSGGDRVGLFTGGRIGGAGIGLRSHLDSGVLRRIRLGGSLWQHRRRRVDDVDGAFARRRRCAMKLGGCAGRAVGRQAAGLFVD